MTALHAQSTYSSPYYTFTTLAGLAPSIGSNDGTGDAAQFSAPRAIAVDGAGQVYIADTNNHTIRKISPGGTVTTLAGLAGSAGSVDGSGDTARIYRPYAIAVDNAGNIYVGGVDSVIRKITPAGVVTTLAGSAHATGSTDGTGAAARFFYPSGLAVDPSGNIYVADTANHTIRKITPDGVVTTLAGFPGSSGSNDGAGSAARFFNPTDVAVDPAGGLYVVDSSNHTIRKITPEGVVSTYAGSPGLAGFNDGTGSAARFNTPQGLTVDGSGNLYLADMAYSTIRKIAPGGSVTTLAGSAAGRGSLDGTGSAARFNYPNDVAMDASGNVYVADTDNHSVRKVTPSGVVTTLAGRVGSIGSADGSGANARFFQSFGVTVDTAGNVCVSDAFNHTLRRIDEGGNVSTLAGTAGQPGTIDGMGAAARMSSPGIITVNAVGDIFVPAYNGVRRVTSSGSVTTPYHQGVSAVAADGAGNMFAVVNHSIVKIAPTGSVTTVAGSAGNSGSSNGMGGDARFSYPSSVVVDSLGYLYVADTGNHMIRKITPDGVVTTLAGSAGFFGSTDGTGSGARFLSPTGITLDGLGNLYVADTGNNIIRKITPGGKVTTIGGLAGSRGAADGQADASRFNYPTGIAVDSLGNVYVADANNNVIRKGTPAPRVASDFNGDGHPDILWQHAATGQRYLWFMNGATTTSDTSLGFVPLDWQIAATADFNDDGHPDLLWQNTATGQRYLWFMNEATTIGDTSLGTVPIDWRIAAAADFNGDGHPDILWEHAVTGQRHVWYMDGATTIGDVSLGVVSADWHMVAAADFNGDGRPDILWEHAVTGQRYIWYMNSATVIGDAPLGTIAADWHMVAAADFNGDGHPDILWEHAVTGRRYLWYMNAATPIGEADLGAVPVDWHIAN